MGCTRANIKYGQVDEEQRAAARSQSRIDTLVVALLIEAAASQPVDTGPSSSTPDGARRYDHQRRGLRLPALHENTPGPWIAFEAI